MRVVNSLAIFKALERQGIRPMNNGSRIPGLSLGLTLNGKKRLMRDEMCWLKVWERWNESISQLTTFVLAKDSVIASVTPEQRSLIASQLLACDAV